MDRKTPEEIAPISMNRKEALTKNVGSTFKVYEQRNPNVSDYYLIAGEYVIKCDNKVGKYFSLIGNNESEADYVSASVDTNKVNDPNYTMAFILVNEPEDPGPCTISGGKKRTNKRRKYGGNRRKSNKNKKRRNKTKKFKKRRN
jgi:hypothetical protein